MIKKTILITMLAIVLIAPLVSANDGFYLHGGDELTAKIIPSSYHVNIGEKFKYTIEATNYTDEPIWKLWTRNMIGTDFGEISAEVNLGSYRSVQIDVEIDIDENIEWYKEGDKYYTVLQPVFEFLASEGQYMVYPEKVVLEIDNIKDGSKYLSAEFADDRQYLLYQEVELELYADFICLGQIENNIIIENISGNEIDEVYYETVDKLNKKYYEKDVEICQIEGLMPSESVAVVAYFWDEASPHNVPENTDVSHQFLLEIDGEYYGVQVEKNYNTKEFYRPEIMLVETYKNDENGKITERYFEITNYSDMEIYNFYVDFTHKDSNMPDYIFPIVHPNETIRTDLPFEGDDSVNKFYNYGYYMEDEDFVVGWGSRNLEKDECVYTEEYSEFHDDLRKGYGWFIDMHHFNLYYDFYPVCREDTQTEPTIEPSPEKTENTPTQTPKIENETAAVVETRQVSYIPQWAWIAVLAAALASSALIYYIKKTKENG
ncbi:MAG: hypothetical protein AB1Z23_01735 [Eubacteriales bacterium]